MRAPFSTRHFPLVVILAAITIAVLGSCNTTRRLKDGEFLLRRNRIRLETAETGPAKTALSDGVGALVAQKPNKYVLGLFPYKLWLYNARYKRYARDSSAAAFQISHGTVERPVVFDSSLMRRSVQNMKAFLFNNGFFYARVDDTVLYHGKKATAEYSITTGPNYLIKRVYLHVGDSAASTLLTRDTANSILRKGEPYNNTLIEEERVRLTEILRNEGYFHLSQEAISFKLDTVDKELLRNADDPFATAIRYDPSQRERDKQRTLDIHVYVDDRDDPATFRRYGIGKVAVYPDFVDRNDLTDSTMYESMVDSVRFRYHRYYVREKVILDHIFLQSGSLYRQSDYDRTITKLNELGLFQYVQVFLIEDTTLPAERNLRCAILLNPTQKYDFLTNVEVTSATSYPLGSALTFSIRNRNLLKGANQLSIAISAGIELAHNQDNGLENPILGYFALFSRNAGVNASIDFPKVIAPGGSRLFRKSNSPRTIVGVGTSLLDRVNYFTLFNTSANFAYNWRETSKKTWDLAPVFVNLLRLPYKSPSFQSRLDSNTFLRNTYSDVFIEGENIAFTFTNAAERQKDFSYSYFRASFEEAGGLVSGILAVGDALGNRPSLEYRNYVKIDADARHYVPFYRSLVAVRGYVGLGLPYNGSVTLPYIKQYFAGGPYSVRGWRVRDLGPGSYYDSAKSRNTGFIDLTGDIKLEANAEYRFDIIQLFSGSLALKGAVFADAGNIWLAKKASAFPGGEFAFRKLGRDIAMSTGAGLRLDIGQLFILRFDLAFPIKKPYYPENGGWVIRQVASYNGWWKDNLISQIAIGYPF